MLAALAIAAGCGAWQPQVTGYYEGTVESRGEKRIETWIDITPEGRLQGHYILHEPTRKVHGTLDAVNGSASMPCETTIFTWTDLYGTGLARLRFHPERRCFDGAWGTQAIRAELTWQSCIRDRVTS